MNTFQKKQLGMCAIKPDILYTPKGDTISHNMERRYN